MDNIWTFNVFLGVLSLCIVFYIRWIFDFWKRRNVPYIKPSLPMGNFESPWAVRKGYHKVMAEFHEEFKSKGHKYGGIFSFLRPVFVPVDLDLLKHIMIKDFQHFIDRGFYFNEVHDPLSAHLFSIEGDKWKHLRTKLSPTFTSGKMKAMFQLVLDCGTRLEKEMDKIWKMNEPVDVKETGALFTTNVIGSCAFGLELNCFDDPNNEFRSYSKQFLQGGIARLMRTLITNSFPELCRKLGVKVFDKNFTDFYLDVVKHIVNHRESTKVNRNDFIQLMLEVKKEGEMNQNPFTIEELAAQAFLIFLAGFETSSSTMSFAFYEMAENQDVQDKVREEIHRVLAKHDGKLTYDAVMEMTYMTQVFDETLRKYPILATLDRICTKDYKVPGEDLVLKKGTKIWISLQGIHHDPEYYPDPQKFDPERFSPENKANRHICEYMPFGEGPRFCVGMRFGIMQAKIGMAIMLRDYKYRISSKMSKMVLKTATQLLAPSEVLLDIEKVN